jgi:hypothetical protein
MEEVQYTNNLEYNCDFPAPGRNYVIQRQALQDFPDTSQDSLHKNNKTSLRITQDVLKIGLQVTVVFRFVDKRTVEGTTLIYGTYVCQ